MRVSSENKAVAQADSLRYAGPIFVLRGAPRAWATPPKIAAGRGEVTSPLRCAQGNYSKMATARTGAAVVPFHLTGNTATLNPCGTGMASRLVMFSR